ncbi:MAG: 50S ribosomal protein L19e [Candidatus Bathyarchaeia archaeon]|nr:50S ribosomal protein L19e [Candidatus Bathyarchaeota archaeon]
MSLRIQRRLAAELLKVGESRIWIDPGSIERVEAAITRDEIKRLIHEGVIRRLPERGVSRGRVRSKPRRRGPGSRKGSTIDRKTLWINRIRRLRRILKRLRDSKKISKDIYRRLYLLAKGGAFRSASHLKEYIERHSLIRRR